MVEQTTNAFPEVPDGQVQTGIWFTTEHNAFWPQVPAHGSLHLLLIQALSLGQSEFKTHSGRQPKYGSPWYSGRQIQAPLIHCVFVPQLIQESAGFSCITNRINLLNNNQIKY